MEIVRLVHSSRRLLVLENESPDEPITKLNLVLDWFEEHGRLSH